MMTLDNLHVAGSGIPEMIPRILKAGGNRLTGLQRKILIESYTKRTGDLERTLSSRPAKVETAGDEVSMTIEYLAYIKFLDLKRGRSGRVKKNHVPIYNKYVYGSLMGYTYGRIRGALAQAIADKLAERTIEI